MTRHAILGLLAVAMLPGLAGEASGADGFIEIAPDGYRFQDSVVAQPFVAIGVNYDHDDRNCLRSAGGCRLIEDYWGSEFGVVDGVLTEISGLGFNVVRIHLQYARFMADPETSIPDALANLDRVLERSRQLGLRVILTGLGHYRYSDHPFCTSAGTPGDPTCGIAPFYLNLTTDEQWQADAAFWRVIAERYRDETAIFAYDLQNEPTMTVSSVANVHDVSPYALEHPGYLNTGFYYVHTKIKGPEYNLLLEDYLSQNFPVRPLSPTRRQQAETEFRHERARAWTKRMVDAIRAVDPNHLLTIGLTRGALPFYDHYSHFHPGNLLDLIDFVSLHLYPRTDVPKDATGTPIPDVEPNHSVQALAAAASLGRPVLIEEWGPLEHSETDFTEYARRHSSGLVGFYWGPQSPSFVSDHLQALVALNAEMNATPPTRPRGVRRRYAPLALRLDAGLREATRVENRERRASGGDVTYVHESTIRKRLLPTLDAYLQDAAVP